jgi:uncharacterized protein (TIGR01370 family)
MNKWALILPLIIFLIGCGSVTAPTQAKDEQMETPYLFLYGLHGFRYADLASDYRAKYYVVDVDDSRLTAPQIAQLQKGGSQLYSYLSIGEAETYRDYWKKGWKPGSPDFILDENKDWQGNYRVKFWHKPWQELMIRKAQMIAKMGYNGVYLDIVDGYQQDSVIQAYQGKESELRQEMEQFVMQISKATKAINPNFKVIPQNALELIADPVNTHQPNQPYLNAIDGLGVESLWYSDNEIADWTKWDLKYIKLAQQAGKFILATSYPTQPIKQQNFLNKALKEGLIPFVGKRPLSKGAGVTKINKTLR